MELGNPIFGYGSSCSPNPAPRQGHARPRQRLPGSRDRCGGDTTR